jgi:hypothetical protein
VGILAERRGAVLRGAKEEGGHLGHGAGVKDGGPGRRSYGSREAYGLRDLGWSVLDGFGLGTIGDVGRAFDLRSFDVEMGHVMLALTLNLT